MWYKIASHDGVCTHNCKLYIEQMRLYLMTSVSLYSDRGEGFLFEIMYCISYLHSRVTIKHFIVHMYVYNMSSAGQIGLH